MSENLSGKVAIATGTSKGMVRAISIALGHEEIAELAVYLVTHKGNAVIDECTRDLP